MLESIHLKNVGPAAEMAVDLAPRLNLITGDNGLGKSFLLDLAWWILTRTWARELVVPRRQERVLRPKDGSKPLRFIGTAKGTIAYSYTKRTRGPYQYTSTYDPAKERWSVKHSRPPIPGLILYAQVDGGYSVWDPARNYWTEDAPDRPNAFLFKPDEVWKGTEFCKGLLDDWGLWQAGKDHSFEVLKQVIETLSPSADEKLVPGELRKLTAKDPQRYPTLRMPYGEDVPVIHASAGMRRIVALAYLLTWAWQEHVESAKIRGERPATEIVFLIDEIEGHLHPQWQRRIVPALLKVMDALTGKHGSKVQLIAATHSPLVLASVESTFDADQDAWFDLDLEGKNVALRKRAYVRLGELDNWLTSPAFDLKEPRGSIEAENAILGALELARQKAPKQTDIERVDALLRASLSDTDRFWVRWTAFRDTHATRNGAKR